MRGIINLYDFGLEDIVEHVKNRILALFFIPANEACPTLDAGAGIQRFREVRAGPCACPWEMSKITNSGQPQWVAPTNISVFQE